MGESLFEYIVGWSTVAPLDVVSTVGIALELMQLLCFLVKSLKIDYRMPRFATVLVVYCSISLLFQLFVKMDHDNCPTNMSS